MLKTVCVIVVGLVVGSAAAQSRGSSQIEKRLKSLEEDLIVLRLNQSAQERTLADLKSRLDALTKDAAPAADNAGARELEQLSARLRQELNNQSQEIRHELLQQAQEMRHELLKLEHEIQERAH